MIGSPRKLGIMEFIGRWARQFFAVMLIFLICVIGVAVLKFILTTYGGFALFSVIIACVTFCTASKIV